MTTLLFRTGAGVPRGGELDFLATRDDPLLSPEHVLDYALEVITAQNYCRLGQLEISNGESKPGPGWRLQRYKTKEDIPKDSFAVYLPGATTDIEDDMEVTVIHAPWVGISKESYC